jgi:hypothetical protein
MQLFPHAMQELLRMTPSGRSQQTVAAIVVTGDFSQKTLCGDKHGKVKQARLATAHSSFACHSRQRADLKNYFANSANAQQLTGHASVGALPDAHALT